MYWLFEISLYFMNFLLYCQNLGGFCNFCRPRLSELSWHHYVSKAHHWEQSYLDQNLSRKDPLPLKFSNLFARLFLDPLRWKVFVLEVFSVLMVKPVLLICFGGWFHEFSTFFWQISLIPWLWISTRICLWLTKRTWYHSGVNAAGQHLLKYSYFLFRSLSKTFKEVWFCLHRWSEL